MFLAAVVGQCDGRRRRWFADVFALRCYRWAPGERDVARLDGVFEQAAAAREGRNVRDVLLLDKIEKGGSLGKARAVEHQRR